MPYPNVATGDLSVSVVSSLFNRTRAASMLAAKSKKEAFNRFKKAGLSDKQAQDAVDHYNFGGAAFKSRFGGDRVRRIRGFFGSQRPQDDITVNEQERVLRAMGLFRRKRKGSTGGVDPETGESTQTGSGDGGPSGDDPSGSSGGFSPLQALLPPAGNNLEEALKGVGRDGEYLTKEQRKEIFQQNKIARDGSVNAPPPSTTSPITQTPSSNIQSASTGDLVGSALAKLFEDKNKELIEVIEDTADKVEDNSELLEKIERNTSFIEKLFDLQREAIDEAKAAKEEAEIDQTKDAAGVAGYKKLKFGGKGGLLSGIPGGGMLGNVLDFGGDILDLFNGRYRRRSPFVDRKKGARRRLNRQRAKRFVGRQKDRLFRNRQKPLRSAIGTRNESTFINNRLYKTEVSQFAPKKKNFLQKGLQRTNIARKNVARGLQKTNIAGRSIAKKLIGTSAKKAGAKAIVKGLGKGVGKALLKKIPILGLGVGALFAAQRAMAGDFVGAGLELASGAASTVPGFGTAASVGIDAALMAKDISSDTQAEVDTPIDGEMYDPNGGEYERGGISEGPEIATLHGKEAVIDLTNQNSNVTNTQENNSVDRFINNLFTTQSTTEKNNTSNINENISKNTIFSKTDGDVINTIAATYGGAQAEKMRQFMRSLNDPNDPFYMAPSSGGGGVPRGRGMGDINPDAFINPFNKRVENKQNIFAKGNTTNFFDKGVQNVNIGDTVKAERGAILDGPDTGYDVELHGTEAIIPLDNKFTRGEPTVTDGGEYEKGNLRIEKDALVKQEEEKIKRKNQVKNQFSNTKKAQKDLAESFRMGLDIYQKETPGGFLGELGQKIMDFLDKFGGGDDTNPNSPDAPPVNVSGGEADMTAATLDGFTEKEVSDLGRIVSAEAGTDEKGGAHVLNAILNRHRQIKQGKASPESWGIVGKTAEEVTITDIINATNQFQPMRDGSFDKTTEGQGRAALAAAIKGGGLDPKMVKQKLIESGMSEEDATIVAVADSFYNPTLSSNKPFKNAKSVSTDNEHAFMSSPNVGFKPSDLESDSLEAVDGEAGKEITTGDTSHQPHQKIANSYGLEVGQERVFRTANGNRYKAHKTTKGFEFFNDWGQRIDFKNGKNQWVVDEFVKSDGGRKPELLKPEEASPPEEPSTGNGKAEEVRTSSAAARDATTARTIAMAIPAPQPPQILDTSGPDTSTEMGPKPSELGFDKLAYGVNLYQLNSVG